METVEVWGSETRSQTWGRIRLVRARHADLEVQNDTAAVFKVRQGKIVEVRGYLDREEALEAARRTE